VIVGYDIAVFIDNEPGTKAPLFKVPFLVFIEKSVKKVPHGVVLSKRAFFKVTKYTAAALDGLDGPDIDHRRAGLFSQVRETFRRQKGGAVFCRNT